LLFAICDLWFNNRNIAKSPIKKPFLLLSASLNPRNRSSSCIFFFFDTEGMQTEQHEDDHDITVCPGGELIFPDDCQAGIYIIECDCQPNSLKIGWTRDINRRLWDYDFASPNAKRYAYALLFRFRDTTVAKNKNDIAYRTPEKDEIEWIQQMFEQTLLEDTYEHRDTLMGTEWRFNLPLDECIERARDIATTIVSDEMLPEELQPEMIQAYNFQTHRLCNIQKQKTRKRQLRKESLFRRWKTNVQAMDTANPQDTDDAQFLHYAHPLVQRPPTPEQHSIVEKAYEWFLSCLTVCTMQLRWMCGMGKTWFALLFWHKLAVNKQAKTCVIAVPSLKLVSQWIPDIQMMFRLWYPNINELPLLLIGSADADPNNDDGTSIDPTRITTDIARIRHFCQHECQRATCDKPVVIITTYHSAHKLVEATRELQDFCFDVLVCDEAHHLAGVTERENLRPFLQTHQIPHKCKLSMTATPKCFTSDNLPEHQAVYSMDNMDQFGEVLDTKPLDWAIKNHKITDYRVCMIQKRLHTVVQWMDQLCTTDFATDHVEKNLCLAYASYIAADLLLRGTNKKLLLYANKTAHADLACDYITQFVDIIRKNNPNDVHHDEVYICSLHASTTSKYATTASEQKTKENEFKDAHCGVICCVQIYGEGVNMPHLDGVVFGEPMESYTRIIQSGFRANRLDDNNTRKVASIVIPVLLPEDFDKQEGANAFMGADRAYLDEGEQKVQKAMCQRMNFDTVQKVLQNISQQDAELATRIEVKEANPLQSAQMTPTEDTRDHDAYQNRRDAQALQNNELNEMVKNMVYKFINRGDMVQWTVDHLVRRVGELSQKYENPVYNEDTYNTLCAKMRCNGATTELPEQSPTSLFKPAEFAWQMVDAQSESYYATAEDCRRGVERLDEDEFVQLCEENGIEPSAYQTLVRVSDLYHEMDGRVPMGLCDRYYLRDEGEAPVEYVVDGVV
jgi:superfamily II DNA or RNA helicase